MEFDDLDKYRNEEGYINLDLLETFSVEEFKVGRKSKFWFNMPDDKIMFKEVNQNSYEDYAHLISAEIYKFLNIEHAVYDLAIYKGKKGVITPDFRKNGERLISGEVLLKSAQTILEENNVNEKLGNNLESVINALMLWRFDEKIIGDVVRSMIKLIVLDGVVLENDRNKTNWSIITESNDVRLSPIYDGSNSFGLNRTVYDISTKVNDIRDTSTLASIINNTTRSLHLKNKENPSSFIEELEKICKSYPNVIDSFIPQLLNVNASDVFNQIEERIKSEIPYSVKLWVGLVLKYNLETVQIICCNNKTK